MLNKILGILFVSIVTISFGQITSTSPYSYYGLGESEGMEHATFSGIGNSKITYFDSTVLNYFNPSTYNTIGKGQPIFSTGLSSRSSFYKLGGITNFNKSITLNHFAFGLSFAKHFGLAVGLKPYSRRGYNFYELEAVGTDTIKHSYTGSGNTNEFFLGFSSDLIHLKNIRLAIGSNVGYVFGNVINSRTANLIGSDSSAGGYYEKLTTLESVHYEFGMYFNQKINDKHSYTLSAVIEPQQDFFGHQSETLYYGSVISNPLSYISLTSSGNMATHFKIAPTTSVGLNYRFLFKDLKKGNKSRNSELSLHASFNTTDWTKFSSRIDQTTSSYNYESVSKTNIGIQYTPEIFVNDKAAHGNILEKTKYRAGFYSYNLPVLQNNLKVIDKGVSLGFGIPILSQRSQSSVNFGFNFGMRGTSNNDLLSEKYIGFNLGFSFAPAIFERWFVKRKLD